MEFLTKNFANWTSGNEKIDNFIQEKQLEYEEYAVFEWIPYNKFTIIEEIGKGGFATAIWKEGPLSYEEEEWIRTSYKKVCLKYLCDSQIITDEFINKVLKNLTSHSDYITAKKTFFLMNLV